MHRFDQLSQPLEPTPGTFSHVESSDDKRDDCALSTVDKAIDLLVHPGSEECDDVLRWLEDCYDQLLNTNVDEPMHTLADQPGASTAASVAPSSDFAGTAASAAASTQSNRDGAGVVHDEFPVQTHSDGSAAVASPVHRSRSGPVRLIDQAELDSIRSFIELDHEYAKVSEYDASDAPSTSLAHFDADLTDDSLVDQEMLDLDCFLNDVSLLSTSFAAEPSESLTLF